MSYIDIRMEGSRIQHYEVVVVSSSSSVVAHSLSQRGHRGATIIKWKLTGLVNSKGNFVLHVCMYVYGRNQSGCEKAKSLGFIPFILLVFLTIYI